MQYAIVDLREIGPTYDWVVLKVRIFDFRLSFQPFGPGGIDDSQNLRRQPLSKLTFLCERGRGDDERQEGDQHAAHARLLNIP